MKMMKGTDGQICSFADLEKQFTEGVHFCKTTRDRGGTVLILAPHGGGIERGTSELARSIAGDDLSFYLFEGLMPTARQSQALHITSTRFDEPRCLKLISKFQKALAIHGCGGKEPMIYVGGKDDDLKNALIAELSARGHPIQLGTGRFAGIFHTNICNRTISGKGVQLELSNGLRRSLFYNWRTRKSRKTATTLFGRLVSDIRDVLE
jgi:phage replication-related protein YjqB (UPF0714/DUF867 family)